MARINGTDGNDTLSGWAPTGLTLRGEGEPDPWAGRDDLIDAKGGDDSIDGGDGSDRLIGGAGKDTLNGGNGSDTILPASGYFPLRVEGNIIDGGKGKDWVSYEDERAENVILALDDSFSYDVIIGIENLRGGGGNDRLTGDGDRNQLEGLGGRDTLSGGEGNDTLRGGDEILLGDDLYGGGGNDSIEGGKGYDRLDGGEGADYLNGGESGDLMDGGRGDDTFEGGLGADTLIGGRGDNLFVYASADEGGDLILDYRGNHDRIQISATGFGGGLVAGQNLEAFGHYIESDTGLATSDAGVGQFIYDRNFGVLYWDADGAGGADAIILIEFFDPSRWTASELVIV